MLPAPAIISVLKYGFLGLVVTGAGFLVANTAILMRQKSEAIEDLAYKARISPSNDSSMLGKNSLRCLTHPSRPFCLMSRRRRLELLRHVAPPSGNHQDKATSFVRSSPHPMYLLLENFKDIMTSLNVKPILLEPSMLFCMLSPLQKYTLISSGLETNVLNGSPNRVTFGILESDARILSQERSALKFLESGYEVSRARKWLETGVEDFSFFTTHYFYSRHNMTIHVIVFFQKHTFLWHPGLSEIDFPIQTEPFGTNCIYENFTCVQLRFENGRESGFYFPSEVDRFLFQIQHSEYKECSTAEERTNLKSHPSLTIDQLTHRVIIAIKELKSVFKHAVFWLWKDTLSGWKESCNLFQRTPEFHVAVQSTEISKMNLNKTSNEYLRLLQFHQLEDIQHKLILDCYGLQINIFIMYKDSRSIWYYEGAGHLTKITYLNFRLCSTSVMGQLVHVPCGNKLTRD